MSTDPQEWTPEYVGSLVGETFNGAWKIADAHNAALAAVELERDAWMKAAENAGKELAAERQQIVNRESRWEESEKIRELVEQQLASEREEHALIEKDLQDALKDETLP
jgi:crotonobetainyl-CoA:carnitine CoA-transferase CaiB-like acyl-CoA transferase